MLAVTDIIKTPSSTNKYQQLKDALIVRFTDSEEKRLRQLIAGIELGDKKLFNLLCKLKQLAGGTVNDSVLQTLWMQRLSMRMQETLAVVDDALLSNLTKLADKVHKRNHNVFIAAIKLPETVSSPTATQLINELEKRLAALEVIIQRGRSRSRFQTTQKTDVVADHHQRAQSRGF